MQNCPMCLVHHRQQLIDSGCAEHRLLERFIEKIVKIKGILPRYLFLCPIHLTEAQPFGGGGYADVYKGEYRDRTMALKVLRIFGRPKDRDQFHKACTAHGILCRLSDVLRADILPGGPYLA